MNKKFFEKYRKVYYDDTEQGLGFELPADCICNILNHYEEVGRVNDNSPLPSDFIDFEKYNCEKCGKEQYSHKGSWNKDPLFFFCSIDCHQCWLADRNELDYCPFCNANKRTYVGKADSYFCYGCSHWYDY